MSNSADEVIPPQRAVARRQAAAVATVDPASMVAMFERLATNPAVDVAKLGALLDLQERIMARQAKMEFDRAFLEMHQRLPTITKRGKIIVTEKGNKEKVIQTTPHELWEDIQRLIDPILYEFGFSLRHKSGPGEGGKMRLSSTLSAFGHEDVSSYDMLPDVTGSKNPVQGLGSSSTYARRYNTRLLLNLRIAGEDDDGRAAGGGTGAVRRDGPARATDQPAGNAAQETGPRPISTVGKNYRLWAQDYIAAIKTAQSEDDLDEFAELNAQMLDAIQGKFPPLYQEIGAAVVARMNELPPAQPSGQEEEPGEAEHGGTASSDGSLTTSVNGLVAEPASPGSTRRRPGPTRGATTESPPMWVLQQGADLAADIKTLLTRDECVIWSERNAEAIRRIRAVSPEVATKVETALSARLETLPKPKA